MSLETTLHLDWAKNPVRFELLTHTGEEGQVLKRFAIKEYGLTIWLSDEQILQLHGLFATAAERIGKEYFNEEIIV